MKKQIKNLIKNLLSKLYWFLAFNRIKTYHKARDIKFMRTFKNVHLTSQEKKAIRELWGNIDLTYHKMMKSVCGFNPMYCGNQFYVNKILPITNPPNKVLGLRNKNLYDNYKHEILLPDTIVKNVKGIFIKDGKAITWNEAIEICLRESEFIIKPVESSGGENIQKMNSASYEKINDTFKLYKQDFIVQKIIKQSAITAKLNQSSLNTFRINTLFLNDKLSVLSSNLRFGVNGAVVDNATAGGLNIKLRENGGFYDFAVNKYGKKITCMNGMNFSSMQIPNYERVENFAKEKHIKMFPHIGIIGWDFALDIDENIVCIEMNIVGPGIYSFQFSGVPIFGDRTREIIDYVNQRKNLRKKIFVI